MPPPASEPGTGVTQEDVTAHTSADLRRRPGNPEYLGVTPEYGVRDGISTSCPVDSREQ